MLFRRPAIRLPLPVLTFLLSLGLTLSVNASSPPNILLLLSDDHSYPFLSAYGAPNVRTPHLDRLAREGILFHRFFTSAPQCVLSRVSLMTGRSPIAADMIRFSSPLPKREITLPELLRQQANYYTGVCGRSFHLDGSNRLGKFVEKIYEKHGMRTFESRVDFLRKGSDAQVAEQFTQFLDQVPQGRPFFMWANFSDPHHVWNAPEEYRPDPSQLQLPEHWPDLPGMRQQLADYCAEVNRVDKRIGQVIAVLESRGLMETTLIVFAGDNGAALPHGKGSLYDPGSNVPFLVRWPQVIQGGRQSSALISGEDLAPTLLQAANLKVPSSMSGQSFLALLKEEDFTAREFLFIARGPHGSAPVRVEASSAPYDMGRAVRSNRYKFIYNCTPWTPYGPVDSARGAAWTQMLAAAQAGKLSQELMDSYFTTPRPVYEFYDLERDPSELRNLSGDPRYAEAETTLRQALVERMILEHDHLPLPELPD
ncbi:MAG: sulfatase [bacterium]|nr:sulfatase [bacterium]